MYHRSLAVVAAAAALSAPALAQYATQNQPAPIQRSYATAPMRPAGVRSTQPAAGVWVRATAPVAVVAHDSQRTELRLEHGIANVTVHDPEEGSIVLVDLPGGQTQLLKNGLYTFNAATNTVRVVRGQADVFPGTESKARKVDEEQMFVFGRDAHAMDVRYRYDRTDLLAGSAYAGNQYAQRYADGPVYRDDYYGYGYYAPYPYYAGWGYPGYGWGGWGYPYGYGFGIGIGYYGGWGRGWGGFRGGRRW